MAKKPKKPKRGKTKTRDYAAEYAARVKRGRELGLSKSQTRGHAKQGERTVKQHARHLRGLAQKMTPKRFHREIRETMTRDAFVKWMMRAGMKEREAYTLWHSP